MNKQYTKFKIEKTIYLTKSQCNKINIMKTEHYYRHWKFILSRKILIKILRNKRTD